MKKSLIVLSLVAVALSSCTKEKKVETPTTAAPTASTPTINIVDADGCLTAVNTVTSNVTPIGTFEVEIGTAVAVFFDNKNTSSFVDAGTVTCESKSLSKRSNNSYVFTPSQNDPSGIDYSGSASWNVSGSGSVTAFNGSLSTFPSNPKWTKTEINTGSAQTVTLDGFVTGADSILVVLSCGSGTVTKTFAGSTKAFYFSADDMAKCGKGDGLVQFAPYKYKLNASGGKKYYLINESVLSVFTKFN